MTAEQALQQLRDGNQRFVANQPTHPHSDPDTRHKVALEGQHPFAAVLTCSDSRVPLELLFDAGIGDLFEIKVAGNVCSVIETASVEFAVWELEVPLVLVLGHTMCGAVGAAISGDPVTGSLKQLVDRVRPSVVEAQQAVASGDPREVMQHATELNVQRSMEDLLLSSRRIRSSVHDGKVVLVGAIYDIDTGEVSEFAPHPNQAEWLSLL